MKKRIFVIDDESDFTHLMKACLEADGYYHVGEQNDAASAVDAARVFDPDLILLDIMMPHLDGSEVAAHMRSDPVLRDVPVVFMTALVGATEAPAGTYTSGGHTFLPKSIAIERLIDCIEQTLTATHAPTAALTSSEALAMVG